MEGRRNLHNEELRRLYSSTDVISVIKWRLVRCLWRTSGVGNGQFITLQLP